MMKITNKMLFSILFLLLTTTISIAQNLPQKAIGIPKIFLNDEESHLWHSVVSKRNWGEYSNNFWKVYIDREGVKSYNQPNNSSQVKENSLKFMSEYFVAALENGYALLYSEKYAQTDLTISKQAKPIGWVSVDELLLWSTCPRTRGQVYQKAVILKDVELIQNKNDINEVSPLFSYTPDGKVKSKNRATELEFYFIYKYVDGAALLINESKISIGKISNTKNGWMKKGLYTTWNDRLCYEPEFGSNSNNEIAVFKDIADAIDYKNYGEISKDALWKDTSPAQRWSPKKVRFPVLSISNSYIAEVGTISSFNNGSKNDSKILEEAQHKLDVLRQKMQQINVVFVIDGTSSMKNYFKPMAEAIKLAMSQNAMQGSRINFGAVIYRDYEDKNKAVEYKSLTKDFQSVANWILGMDANSIGKSHYEAMFLGLETALDKMSWTKENGNFLVLVGDAGNQLPDPQKRNANTIIRKIAEKEINFIAYQVNHPDNIAYHDFVSQTQNIMNRGLSSILNRPISKKDFEQDGHLYSAKIAKNDVLTISAGYHYASVNSQESPAGLKKLIEDKIIDFKDQTEQNIAELDIIVKGGSGAEINGSYNAGAVQILKNIGLTDEEIKSLAQSNMTLKIKGHTSRVAAEETVFIPSVFMAKEELQELIQSLSKVTRSISTDRRLALQKALSSLALSYIGQSADNDNISIDQIMRAITGVKITSGKPILSGINLKNITNPNIYNGGVSEAQIDDFIKQIENGITILRRKETDRSCYFESNNGLRYYYILLNDMPLQ